MPPALTLTLPPPSTTTIAGGGGGKAVANANVSGPETCSTSVTVTPRPVERLAASMAASAVEVVEASCAARRTIPASTRTLAAVTLSTICTSLLTRGGRRLRRLARYAGASKASTAPATMDVIATIHFGGPGHAIKGPKPQKRYCWPCPPALQPSPPSASSPGVRQRASRKQSSVGPAQSGLASSAVTRGAGAVGGGRAGGDGKDVDAMRTTRIVIAGEPCVSS
mmetsp:Transcript_20962/g.53612  ORF Transcript_20962/g.53612 Transcript_20962/m.53612 type:complete len:224 (-) Transcript_20962:1483-2154(-)